MPGLIRGIARAVFTTEKGSIEFSAHIRAWIGEICFNVWVCAAVAALKLYPLLPSRLPREDPNWTTG
jgi:hypothetical protein